MADEPVSALDVSVQAQVLNLLQDLQQKFGVSFLLIGHDLAVVNHLCDEVVVLYQGKSWSAGHRPICSTTRSTPYTQALVAAVPHVQPGGPVRGAWLRRGDGIGQPVGLAKAAAEVA